jgi:hypothetical protein
MSSYISSRPCRVHGGSGTASLVLFQLATKEEQLINRLILTFKIYMAIRYKHIH